MSPIMIGILGIVALLLLLALRMPIGFAMGIVGFIGYSYLVNMRAGLSILGSVPYSVSHSYILSVIPLFVLMGQLIFQAGISARLYNTANKWIGHMPGGLAMATIGGCAGLSAVSGSSLATAATMGAVALPEMKKYDYNPALATGSVAAGGTLGILIPPSTVLVLYAVLAEQSVGKMLLAGILPGLLLALLFMITIYITCRINPLMGPRGPKTTIKDKLISLTDTFPILILFVVVMGGIYAGVFTPTEASAIGALGAFIFVILKGQLTFKNMSNALTETAFTTAMAFIIIIGANIFGIFMAVTTIPMTIAGTIEGMGLSKYAVLAVIVIIYMILGCFMEGLAMLVLTLPIFYPLIIGLGFDPIWFGVVVVVLIEMGLITPPVGVNVFVVSGVAKEIPMHIIFRGIIPFWLAMIVCVIILSFFPQIALILPNLMR